MANGGGFDVQLSYTYAEELTSQTFSVSVTDHNATAGASTSTFSVADAALTAGRPSRRRRRPKGRPSAA